jgi:hypothetical protein
MVNLGWVYRIGTATTTKAAKGQLKLLRSSESIAERLACVDRMLCVIHRITYALSLLLAARAASVIEQDRGAVGQGLLPQPWSLALLTQRYAGDLPNTRQRCMQTHLAVRQCWTRLISAACLCVSKKATRVASSNSSSMLQARAPITGTI